MNRTVRIIAILIALCMTVRPVALKAQETGIGAVNEAERLRNAGQFDQAIILLKAHLRAYPDDGEAIRLLAQTQYWAKDFRGARATYERAVKLHPEDTTLRAQYAQFLAETATERGWVKFSPAFRHDDQPLDRLELQAQAGFFLSPGSSAVLEISALSFQLGDTATRSAASASFGFSRSDAKSGLQLELFGGLVHRSFDDGDFIGRAGVSVPLNASLRLRGLVRRDAYFYTEASLSSAVTTNKGAAFLSLNSSKAWLGEASIQLERFPDDNTLATAYAWVLAPIVRSAAATFHAGYSGAVQTTSEMRFELEHPNQAVSPASPNFNFAGRYNPYYTPMDLHTHSVIAALAFGLNSPAVVRLNGGYAVIGTENSPQFIPVARTAPPRTEAVLTFKSRDTHPWNARGVLELNSSGNSALMLGAETSRTAFYSSVAAFAAWTLKF